MTPEERQLRLEADSLENGLERYRNSRERSRATSRLGLDFLTHNISSLAKLIQEDQDLLLAPGQKGRLPNYAVCLLVLDHEKLALIALREILTGAQISDDSGKPPSWQRIARAIGERCRIERQYDVIRERAREIKKLLNTRNKNKANASARSAQKAAEVGEPATAAESDSWLNLGQLLLKLAVDMGTVDTEMIYSGTGKSLTASKIVRLSRETEKWLEERNNKLEILAPPVHLPMIVPPLPWTGLSGGGYLINKPPLPFYLVKARGARRGLPILEKADLQQVYSAVNLLQETPWRLNNDILRIARMAEERRIQLPGMGFERRRSIPQRLPEGSAEDLVRKNKVARKKAYKFNAKLMAERATARAKLAFCSYFEEQEVETFFFPHQLDHRGRIYTLPQTLTPQSDDFGRSLLLFGKGVPLGPEGARWLAIHLANTFGRDKLDKKSFDERIQWVQKNQDKIAAIVDDPIGRVELWVAAKKPWSFLAACQEWAKYCSLGPGFSSCLPVSIDGTCNGLQHLSAMGLDQKGGQATNLLPCAEPADLYELVANRLRVYVEQDALAGHPSAKIWMEHIGRDLVKESTMTTPYGVTDAGIREQLRDNEAVIDFLDDWREVQYLTPLLRRSIDEIVVVAPHIQRWLEAVARTLAQAKCNVVWTVPSGFRVLHEERRKKPRRVATKGLSVLVYEEGTTATIDQTQLVRSMAPNFVHSFDAAHLVLTVSRLRAASIPCVATVHDSYAVNAAHVGLLRTVLREEFVRIYREPILRNFLAEQKAHHPELQFPELPELANGLNIESVLASEYFFC